MLFNNISLYNARLSSISESVTAAVSTESATAAVSTESATAAVSTESATAAVSTESVTAAVSTESVIAVVSTNQSVTVTENQAINVNLSIVSADSPRALLISTSFHNNIIISIIPHFPPSGRLRVRGAPSTPAPPVPPQPPLPSPPTPQPRAPRQAAPTGSRDSSRGRRLYFGSRRPSRRLPPRRAAPGSFSAARCVLCPPPAPAPAPR